MLFHHSQLSSANILGIFYIGCGHPSGNPLRADTWGVIVPHGWFPSGTVSQFLIISIYYFISFTIILVGIDVH